MATVGQINYPFSQLSLEELLFSLSQDYCIASIY